MNKAFTYELSEEAVSAKFASVLAARLSPPLILTFSGEIGAGKTTIIRAMLRQLGVSSAIKSPTFSLVESYSLDGFVIHHFDLYRIYDEMELEYLGFRDYLTEEAICCIEWPEHGAHFLEKRDLHFELSMHGEGRMIKVMAHSRKGETMVDELLGIL